MKTVNRIIVASVFGLIGLLYGTYEIMLGMGGNTFKISILDIVWYFAHKYPNLNINIFAVSLISYFVIFFVLGLIIIWIYYKTTKHN